MSLMLLSLKLSVKKEIQLFGKDVLQMYLISYRFVCNN